MIDIKYKGRVDLGESRDDPYTSCPLVGFSTFTVGVGVTVVELWTVSGQPCVL